jgi:hypothetical protein
MRKPTLLRLQQSSNQASLRQQPLMKMGIPSGFPFFVHY